MLLTSLATNLGILGFFKYFNFFVDSAHRLLESVGFVADAPVLNIVLPVGISFYTFQTMAYTIDVYRRRLSPEENLIHFGVYVAYFPQLVAGPIERAQNLLPQIKNRRVVTGDQIVLGLVLILVGLIRKVVIADNAAVYADLAFSQTGEIGWKGLIKGVLYFSLQIYGDFSGYSNIARGSSRLLGIELMRNFDRPYFASDITTFWRRWHISLSTWLRDYLYIPLGGNRHGDRKMYRNLLLTILLGGLWHGAGWNFVVWGAIHGGALALHKWWTGRRGDRSRADLHAAYAWFVKIVSWSTTLTVVIAAWIFFPSPVDSDRTAVPDARSFGGVGFDVGPDGLAVRARTTLSFDRRVARRQSGSIHPSRLALASARRSLCRCGVDLGSLGESGGCAVHLFSVLGRCRPIGPGRPG